MLLTPLFCPTINLNVMNQVNTFCQAALRKLRTSPSVRHQMVVVAIVLVKFLANPRERTNQMIQTFRICVNE